MKRGASEIIYHEKWSRRTLKHDIGLIRVDKIMEFAYHDHITPICLPWNTDNFGYELEPGKTLQISGWGRLTEDSRATIEGDLAFSQDVLQKANVQYAPNYKCVNQYGQKFDGERQLCAEDIPGNF